jgi:DEAD/DEAH box helicase domain-containing protein
MRTIIFDIETRNTFDEVGSPNPADLDISCVCIWDSKTDEYTSYELDELDKLWPILEASDCLVGYNSLHFDLPLLNKYYLGDLSKIKQIDLMKEIQEVIGRRIKLDDVASATMGTKKSADGLQAVLWWKQGKIEEIIKYCIQDVKVTKDVYDHAIEHGFVYYPNQGKKEEIPLDTSGWNTVESEGGLTMGLGL